MFLLAPFVPEDLVSDKSTSFFKGKKYHMASTRMWLLYCTPLGLPDRVTESNSFSVHIDLREI